jgi:para-aminobenzoate synthetase component 2
MKVLLIDNIDSFVYNLAQYIGELGCEVVVKRNKISKGEIAKINPDRIVLSPGPGHPRDSGATLTVLEHFYDTPTLGVCLGHQAIGLFFGGEVDRAEHVLHGKTSLIYHDGKTIFRNLENPFTAIRYHSLLVRKVPSCLEVSAKTKEGEVMGLRHRKYPIEGVQFHPESVLTTEGKALIENFLELKPAGGIRK